MDGVHCHCGWCHLAVDVSLEWMVSDVWMVSICFESVAAVDGLSLHLGWCRCCGWCAAWLVLLQWMVSRLVDGESLLWDGSLSGWCLLQWMVVAAVVGVAAVDGVAAVMVSLL